MQRSYDGYIAMATVISGFSSNLACGFENKRSSLSSVRWETVVLKEENAFERATFETSWPR